jgi:branched-chain amino acid transport system permease protein
MVQRVPETEVTGAHTVHRPAFGGLRGIVGRWWRPTEIRPPRFRRHPVIAVVVFALLALVIGPVLANSAYDLSIINTALLFAIAGVGFYYYFALAGRFAFIQGLWMLTAAYMTAYISRSGNEWIGVGLGVVVVAVMAAVFGGLLRKAEGFLFAIACLGLSTVAGVVYINWPSFTGLQGITANVPYPDIFGVILSTQGDMFWLFLVVLCICLLMSFAIERSPVYREAVAASHMPEVALSLGIPIYRVQVALFIYGSALGALSGGLFALWQGAVSSDSFGVTTTLSIFLMTIIGGIESAWGTVIGAAFYASSPAFLQGLSDYSNLIYGVLIVVILIALPEGLIGLGGRAIRAISKRVQKRS